MISLPAIAAITNSLLEHELKTFMVFLALHGDYNTGTNINPGAATIARELGRCESEVRARQRACLRLGVLVADGYVHGTRGQRANFKISVEALKIYRPQVATSKRSAAAKARETPEMRARRKETAQRRRVQQGTIVHGFDFTETEHNSAGKPSTTVPETMHSGGVSNDPKGSSKDLPAAGAAPTIKPSHLPSPISTRVHPFAAPAKKRPAKASSRVPVTAAKLDQYRKHTRG